ncbi:MAG TPA: hypothetical protein VFR67_16650 [Pilimelia sp.]|nr:hypothetical protein [Pilimelia sp.]
MNRLEERYRSVLRVLPASYRREWEDDMVAAFLESMACDDPDDAAYVVDFGRPSLAETASVIALAARLRLGIGEARLWSAVWRPAIHLAVLAALLTHAVLGAAYLGIGWWLSGKISGLPAPPSEWVTGDSLPLTTKVGIAASLGWLVAYAALVSGLRNVARGLAVAVTALTLAAGTLTGGGGSTMLWFEFGFDVLLVLSLAALPAHTPPARRLPWLVALPTGTAVILAISVVPPAPDGTVSPVDWPGVCCVAVVIAAAVHLAQPAARARPAVSLALVMLATAVLGVRAATLLDYLRVPPFIHIEGLVIVSLVQIAAVLAVGIPAALLAGGALRRPVASRAG